MRKLIYTSIFFTGLLILHACNQDEFAQFTFDVSTLKSSYEVGETIEFNFSGNPYMITYYSGESGKKYENRDRTTVQGLPKLRFTSLVASGTQVNSLHLMVSSDFQGIVTGDDAATLNNIAKATWTDITSRATLSSGTSAASGAIDLSNFAALEKPVYIAFKYTAESGSIQRKWTISGLTVTNELPDGSIYTLANLTSSAISNYGNSNLFSPGWVSYNIINSFKWTVGSTLVITGATTAAAATDPAEAWVFTGPIDLHKVTPDLGVPVKTITTRMNSYTTRYTVPGTYTATFVGSNANVYGVTEKKKQIELTITD
ncbi:MAG: DUF5017 domain-containing protein [Mangrovibacterium sp.]